MQFGQLPPRLPTRVWIAVAVSFVAAYGFMFSVVHIAADTRPCLAHLPDPLFSFVPFDGRWYFVSHDLYYAFNLTGTLTLLIQAIRGDHRGLARFGAGLTLMAVMRSVTITLLPICKATVPVGSVFLTEIPTLNLGFAQIPWRMWATNDLIFSGHVCEFLLLSFPARLLLAAFQLLQAYALIATRGHYTIDVLLAIPFALLADRLAFHALRLMTRNRALA
jgi:hypothetical protein